MDQNDTLSLDWKMKNKPAKELVSPPAPQLDTAQRRAEAFYNSLLKSAGVLGYETPNGRYKRLQLLAKHDAETRRAALEEAAQVAITYGERARDEDLSGGYTSELIAKALDRLAQEG